MVGTKEEGEGSEEYVAFGPGPNLKSSAHAPQPTQTAEGGVFFQSLSGEEDGSSEGRTISRSMIHLCEQGVPDRSAMLAFARRILGLRWNDRRIARVVRLLASEERAIANLVIPDVCADLRA
jgi:hypothetical protein